MTPAEVELIAHWRFRAHRVQLAHYESARKFDRLHLWLGLPAVALSTIVGTSVFASLSKPANITLQIVVGLFSVTAAVLAALQTFFKYSELSEKHRIAGAKFANLEHRLELLGTMPPASADELKKSLTMIEDTWAKLREESPNLPGRVWQRIERDQVLDKQAPGFKADSPTGRSLPSNNESSSSPLQ